MIFSFTPSLRPPCCRCVLDDRVLEINGSSMVMKPHKDAIILVEKVKMVTECVVLRLQLVTTVSVVLFVVDHDAPLGFEIQDKCEGLNANSANFLAARDEVGG